MKCVSNLISPPSSFCRPHRILNSNPFSQLASIYPSVYSSYIETNGDLHEIEMEWNVEFIQISRGILSTHKPSWWSSYFKIGLTIKYSDAWKWYRMWPIQLKAIVHLPAGNKSEKRRKKIKFSSLMTWLILNVWDLRLFFCVKHRNFPKKLFSQ